MKIKTIVALFAVVVAGVCIALPFQQVQTAVPNSPLRAVPKDETHGSMRVVPLALTPAEHLTELTGGGEVTNIPSLQRVPEAVDLHVPELANTYASPLRLLGLTPQATANPLSRVESPAADQSLDSSAGEPLPIPTPRFHVVVDGDTLASIAARYLGNADRASDIFLLNREVLDDPQLLPIGQQLALPSNKWKE